MYFCISDLALEKTCDGEIICFSDKLLTLKWPQACGSIYGFKKLYRLYWLGYWLAVENVNMFCPYVMH